jgi:hypothetical protein
MMPQHQPQPLATLVFLIICSNAAKLPAVMEER